ncbi:MAG TPA: cbb3-type cytochrome c oxidase subunit II [Roseimicrobium sp.]|nr:cbb3-type cytochrome c oxidase subunit II [Roseimicrobium sp.]
MKSLEKFNVIFLGAGVGLLLLGFVTLGLVPAIMTQRVKPLDVFPTEVPDDFQQYYKTPEEYRTALFRGRDLYVREACWHCHSQYVRPVGNEALRYGPESTVDEYQNKLQLPQLFGTRRVGPDLIREHGKHANDWQFVHLYNPRDVVPMSVMPGYTWYFNADKTPKPDAVALVAYLQWLGSWIEDKQSNVYETRP